MILKMFTVYDSKAEAYLPPFFMRSTGEAIRSWTQAINDQNSTFSKHPADFTLFMVGEFDDNACAINVLKAIENLGCAIEYKEPQLDLSHNTADLIAQLNSNGETSHGNP